MFSSHSNIIAVEQHDVFWFVYCRKFIYFNFQKVHRQHSSRSVGERRHTSSSSIFPSVVPLQARCPCEYPCSSTKSSSHGDDDTWILNPSVLSCSIDSSLNIQKDLSTFKASIHSFRPRIRGERGATCTGWPRSCWEAVSPFPQAAPSTLGGGSPPGRFEKSMWAVIWFDLQNNYRRTWQSL